MTSAYFPVRLPAIGAALAALCLTMLPAGPAYGKAEPLVGSNYGPPPDWTRYRELGEAALRNILTDPESARITWPNGYVQRGYTPWLHRRVYGYATCGLVNSRNRMGGYAGSTYFGVVIDHDQVLFVGVGDVDGVDFLSKACAKANFSTAAEMMASKSPIGSSPRGFILTDTPQGAFAMEVTPGGAADRAGLKQHDVVTQLNGIALKGMSGVSITEMVNASTGAIVLTLTTGAVVTIPNASGSSSAAGSATGSVPRS